MNTGVCVQIENNIMKLQRGWDAVRPVIREARGRGAKG